MQPIDEFVRTLLRYLPAITAFMVVSVGAAFLLTSPGSANERTAGAQVGLTTEVIWPFYDAARDRAAGVVTDPAFATTVAEGLTSGELVDLDVEMPANQAFIRIEATATSRDAAVEAANRAAELVIESDRARLSTDATTRLSSATSTLEASEARVAEMDLRDAELIEVVAAAEAELANQPSAQSPRATIETAETERSSLALAKGEETRRQVELRVDQDEARAAADNVIPELEFLRRANADATSTRSQAVLLAAAIGALIVGVALAIVWDRTRGRVRSRWHAEQVARVPVLAQFDGDDSPDRAIGVVGGRLLDAAADVGPLMAVTGLEGVSVDPWISMAVQHFERAGVRVIHVTPRRSDAISVGSGRTINLSELEEADSLETALGGVSTITLPNPPSLVRVPAIREQLREVARLAHLVLIHGGVAGQSDADYATALADGSVLVAHTGHSTVSQLRGAAAAMAAGGGEVIGVVLDGIPVSQGSRAAARASAVAGHAVESKATVRTAQ